MDMMFGTWNVRNLYSAGSLLPKTVSVLQWSEFVATDPVVPGSILGATSFLRSTGSGTGSTQPREYN
jgi:hypothetical protein